MESKRNTPESVRKLLRSFAEDTQADETISSEGQRSRAPAIDWAPLKPVLAALGALLVFTVIGAMLYPRTISAPPTPTAEAESVATPEPEDTAVATLPQSTTPVPVARRAVPTVPVNDAYPAPGVPFDGPLPIEGNRVTPTAPAGEAYPAPGQRLEGTPYVPSATPSAVASPGRTPQGPRLLPTAISGPFSGIPTVAPGSLPSPASPPQVAGPAAPTGTPSATPVPLPTSTPSITPTPAPASVNVTVPGLPGGTGFYYVINARAGDVSGSWKVNGGGTVQMFLYNGAPFGNSSGSAGIPLGGAIAQSNVSPRSVSITPVTLPAGTYTLYFFCSAVGSVSTTSASVTYMPIAQSVPTPAGPTPMPTRTPTPRGTPGPQATPGPQYTASPGPTPTPTSTPVPPEPSPTSYPPP